MPMSRRLLQQPGCPPYENDEEPEFEAQLASAAATPDDVYGDKLRAILANCKTSLPVVREVSDGKI